MTVVNNIPAGRAFGAFFTDVLGHFFVIHLLNARESHVFGVGLSQNINGTLSERVDAFILRGQLHSLSQRFALYTGQLHVYVRFNFFSNKEEIFMLFPLLVDLVLGDPQRLCQKINRGIFIFDVAFNDPTRVSTYRFGKRASVYIKDTPAQPVFGQIVINRAFGL